MDRFPERPSSELSEEQRAVHQMIEARRGRVPAPFMPLLGSPVTADLFERLSAHLWSRLPSDVLEGVFLMMAQRMRCDYQWHTHVDKALAAGVSVEEIAVIEQGGTLERGLLGSVSCLVGALHRGDEIPQSLFEDLKERLTEPGLVDLVVFCGNAFTVASLLKLRQPSFTASL